MMKLNKKEHPVSMLKLYIHDEVLQRLEWIRDFTKMNNNVEAICACINHTYTQLKQFEEYQQNKEDKTDGTN